MTLLSQCYSMRGLEVVSAVNISTTVSNLFFCAFFSMGNSIAIIIGQLLGAGEWRKLLMRTESSSPLLSRCVPQSAW